LILWFGWYGFNCGSTLAAAGAMELASKVAVNTTLAAACGGIIVACLERFFGKFWCVPAICNGVLGGLVSITAPCAVVKPAVAIPIGLIGGALCWGASKLLEKLKIDDPLDAWPVHGVCGAWGVIAAGLFAIDEDDIDFAGYSTDISYGQRLGNQLLAVVMIALWCCVNGLMIFGGMSFFKMLRVDLETEKKGLDWMEHGGAAYNQEMPYAGQKEMHKPVLKEQGNGQTISPSEGKTSGAGSTTGSSASCEDEVVMTNIVARRLSSSHHNLPMPGGQSSDVADVVDVEDKE